MAKFQGLSCFKSTFAAEAKYRNLQTAVAMLFGLDIDPVNLGKEDGDDDTQ
jgi:hypothetical protein